MRRLLSWLALLTIILAALLVPGGMAQPSAQWFPATGYQVREPFLSFWQRGGLERFGYPISPEFQEQNPDDGQLYTVQYFERARFERQTGTRAPIQLGRLGAQHLSTSIAQQPRTNRKLGAPLANPSIAETLHALRTLDCTLFVETGQQLCGEFGRYWHEQGGLELFGYPLTPPELDMTPDGQIRIVQYTERARLEIDPTSQQISLGLLGRALYVPVPAAQSAEFTLDSVSAALLELVNSQRQQAGLAPLAPAPELMASAQMHSQDMATSGLISHTGSDGRTARQRITDSGYPWLRCGENIAVWYPTPEQVMQFWMGSPPHRANLLDPGMQEIGIGYVRQAAGYEHYWTINLGER